MSGEPSLQCRFAWAAALALAASVSNADDLSWSVTAPTSSNTNSGCFGTEFTPSVNVTVTSLGYYDDVFSGPSGLSSSHPVGIYSVSTQALVVSASVPAGTGTTLVNYFRFVPVAPTQLLAGTTYVIAAVSTGDNGRNVTPGSSMTSDPRIPTSAWRSGSGITLSFPGTVVTSASRFMGPAFQFTTVPPPDVGTPGWTIPFAQEANTGNYVNGTEFTPSRPIFVVGLGYYDDTFAGGDGLLASHTVGVYRDGSPTVLASATVPAGAVLPKVNQFRFVTVPRVRLDAGVRYIVAGTGAGDWDHNIARLDATPPQGITLGNWRGNFNQSLSYPGDTISTTTLRMGPNFTWREATCLSDFNGDGDTATDADIEAFFACIAGNCCPLCGSGDFNGDGDVATDSDIESFFRVLSGNGC